MPTSTPRIAKPSTSSLPAIGGTAAAASLMWIASIAAIGVVDRQHVQVAVYIVAVAAAVTTTVAGSVLAVGYYGRCANSQNQVIIHEAIGRLAAEVEQIGAKVDKIDPWTIYTAVAADLLGQDGQGQGRRS